MSRSAILPDRAIIALEGAEARDFLQGLITNDVEQCSSEQALYAAMLTPQGKILYEFFVIERDEALLLDCAAAVAPELIRRLGFYRLRAKVQIAARPDLRVGAIWPAPPGQIEGIRAYRDPRLPELGIRLLDWPDQVEAAVAAFPRGDYESFRLELGIPDSTDLLPDQVFPLDAGLEELHGVSFSKGCYVGQEVTARMKHRSTARRRFYIAETDPLPPSGTAMTAQGREVGRMASGKQGRGLALVRIDRVAEAEKAQSAIEAGGHPVVLRKPNWLHA